MAATKERARARMRLLGGVRCALVELGYEEVETPALVPAPGQEPHLTAFEATFVPEVAPVAGGAAKTLYLHTSPEYAMKRLLADGWPRIFQICRTYRNGEIAAHHNPEFTMLEFYAAAHDYRATMDDLECVVEAAIVASAGRAQVGSLNCAAPFERLTVREAFVRYARVDPFVHDTATELRRAAQRAGVALGAQTGERSWDDVFFEIMLTAVEPAIGRARPTFLYDWPVSQAALARVRTDFPPIAERFELYAGGLELANGFSELNDSKEQRARLVGEQEERRRLGHPVYPLDEAFLEAVGRMPSAGGVAVGLDRLAMLATASQTIADVLLFPACDFT